MVLEDGNKNRLYLQKFLHFHRNNNIFIDDRREDSMFERPYNAVVKLFVLEPHVYSFPVQSSWSGVTRPWINIIFHSCHKIVTYCNQNIINS